MPDTFAITIIFIVVSTIVAAFVRGRNKDRCLRSFSADLVTIEETNGKTIWGKLRVENTGLELVYEKTHKDKSGHDETSYILYKNEYPNIQVLIRFHDDLDEHAKKERDKKLNETYQPTDFKRYQRKTRNFFNTVRDSVLEVANLLIGQAKKTAPGGAVLTSQDKYVSQMKKELVGVAGTSFEPLLERHIGKRVVLELAKGDKLIEYPCILKDYTAEFIEVMDVLYKIKDNQKARKADLLVLRKYGVIRHLGEGTNRASPD